MRTIALAATLTAGALALTACGGGGSGHPGDEGAPTVRGDVQTSPSPAAAQTTAKAGQPQNQDVDGYRIAVTVYSYRQPLPSEESPSRSGYVFAGVDIRMCVKGSPGNRPVSISSDPWSLSYADETAIEPEFADSDSFSVPLYPQDSKAVAVGDCVRGWVVFEVPKTKRPARTVYTASSTDEPAAPLRWTIG